MDLSSGHWYAVLSSRELGRRPVGKRRFGEALVFWRAAGGDVACLEDRCAHRGSALSLGRLRDGVIECPFHGFRFDPTGRCVRVPAEGDDWPIPDNLRVRTRVVREGGGYLWLWRGPAVDGGHLPDLPCQSLLDGLTYGEIHYIWNSHYTRCIENVIDYSHLPFVHRRNLGFFIRNPRTRVRVESVHGGFRFYLGARDSSRQFVEFTYPNLWLNRIGRRFYMATTFAPVDDTHTEVYVRWYHPLRWPLLRQLVDVYGRWSQHLVFKDDLPIVSSQRPVNVDDASHDRLVPSDAGLVAYRKLRRSHQEQARRWEVVSAP